VYNRFGDTAAANNNPAMARKYRAAEADMRAQLAAVRAAAGDNSPTMTDFGGALMTLGQFDATDCVKFGKASKAQGGRRRSCNRVDSCDAVE